MNGRAHARQDEVDRESEQEPKPHRQAEGLQTAAGKRRDGDPDGDGHDADTKG